MKHRYLSFKVANRKNVGSNNLLTKIGPRNFALVLWLLLLFFFQGAQAQTQFWKDDFDAGSPTSPSVRIPEENGGVGNPATSYFKLTDGSTVSQVIAFTGHTGNYWAGEDHNAAGTGFTASGAQGAATTAIQNELQIEWTGINITGKSGLSFKGLFAANSTSSAWDNQFACYGTLTTTNTDYIIVEYKVGTGAYVPFLRFYCRGGSGTDKNLYEDLDGDGCGEGTMLTNIFGEFTKTIPATGSTISLRIRVFCEGSNEEWGIDNFRLFETVSANALPTATGVSNTGTLNVGQLLTGNYTYADADGNAENGSTYKWYRSDDAAGTNKTAIAAAVANTYALAAADLGKYISFEVTPRDGTAFGTAVESSKRGPVVTSPSVSSTAASAVGAVKATLGGNVTADGGTAVTERGIVWGLSANPTIAGNKVANGSGTGTFSAVVSGLTAGSTINFRAYATNSVTTSYGSNLTFTTNAALSASTSSVAVTCFGSSNGLASVSATGGAGSYTYSWSPSGGAGASATGRSAGTYVCTITDSEGTSITRSVTVGGPTAALSATGSQTNVSTYGASNGTAAVVASGGTAGYSYSWNPVVSTSANATGLIAGSYVVTITDANSCTTTTSFTITQPAGISGVTSATANGTYKVNDAISIQVAFSAAVTVTGIPVLALNAGGNAAYTSGSGSGILTFAYQVAAGNQANDLDYNTTGSLTLAGGSIKDGSGVNATLVLPAPGAAGSLGANKNIVVDGVAPSVVISSIAGASGSNFSSSPIPITVTFSKSVTGFVVGDLTVTNGTISGFSGSGTTYNFNVAPIANGQVTVALPAGQALDAAGNTNSAATSFQFNYFSTLPVSLLSFTAKTDGNSAKLEWLTAAEQNNNRFEIWRSADAKNFVPIGRVLGGGTTTDKKSYFFYDRNPLSGVNYYSLKQFNNNNTMKELGQKSVSFSLNGKDDVLIYPNPAHTEATIRFAAGATNLQLTDLTGKVLKTFAVKPTDTSLSIDISTFGPAIYFIRLDAVNGSVVKKLIKL